ncbi:C-type lectin domain family 2 member H-like [Acomys russatus]|uniref:C-type lectin domain family 2 member H-like n=1 Tax=Acomys russatus TaxID=60746 RepID=UPI0021E228CF|nr:C-type lectin domain family 2 member H-like [Acomys russatus]
MSEEIKLTNSGDFQPPGNNILSTHPTESQEFQTRNKRRFYILEVTSLIFLLVIVGLAATLAVEKQKIPTDPTSCLDDWIGYHRKCFYFSENTTTWGASQNFCASYTASLAIFNTTKELNFLKKYKGVSDHWIGLHRESSQHPWRWTDNTENNNLVPTRGEGECAYLSDSGISSGRNYTHRRWICRKQLLRSFS